MQTTYTKFSDTLKQLFMIDVAADLDFGIYRIMNVKRREIESFINNKLNKEIDEVLSNSIDSDAEAKKMELESTIKKLIELGAPVNTNPKVIKLRSELDISGTKEKMLPEVLTHLDQFFSRYYDNGDFISKRRYSNKKDTYSLPYNGEEVKLYWANYDQYYIKNGENFKNYRFRIDGDKFVEFSLKDATTEINDQKGKREFVRRFKVFETQPLEKTDDGVLHIYFTYELMPKATRQDSLDAKTIEVVTPLIPNDFVALFAERPTEKKPHRTLLEKQLSDYTRKNSSDYFIHKDLNSFLTRELDFYIKNEILLIDDIDTAEKESILRQIAVVKTVKNIGRQIITFLTQLEEYQKALWLKKKFVVSADYCLTLDKIPEELYPEICENERQRKEWVKLFEIEKIKDPLGLIASYSEPLTETFLKENLHLVVDTAFFSLSFKHRLLSSMNNIDGECAGLLVNSDNFQALSLLQEKYQNAVKSIYIDPPYNTGDDDFVYKDNYQESSWLSCLSDRLSLCKTFFADGGSISVSIDIKEINNLISLLDLIIGSENRKANITVRRASITGAKVINPGLVNISENVIMYANGNGKWKPQDAFRERDYDDRYGKMIINPTDNYENWQFSTVLDQFALFKKIQKSKLRKILGDKYEDELLEYIIANANAVIRLAALDEDSVSKDVIDLCKESKKNPTMIYQLKREDFNNYYILNGQAILFYKDRLKIIGSKLVPVEKVSDIWDDVLPNDIHNEGGVVLKKGKKPEKLIDRILEATSNEGDLIMDFFAGSGTSGAVALKSGRKFINVEVNEYFDNITLRRIKNTLHGDRSGVTDIHQWKGGGMVKYIRLEQYEDTLNNLHAVKEEGTFDEDYTIRYMLNVETADSLFNLKWFRKPFDARMQITQHNEMREREIDLIETFNYLIGLNIEKMNWPNKDIQITTGTTRKGETTLIVWRDVETVGDDALYSIIKEHCPNLSAYHRIYINGDTNIAAKVAANIAPRIAQTEIEFKRKMFNNN